MAEGDNSSLTAASAAGVEPSKADRDRNPVVDLDKKKVVVIMGATGAGKSKLSIDLASYFSRVEIINADSMQVYNGLDLLTNKVPVSEQNGVIHHLLGTVDSSDEFTCKDFRDLAIPIIDDILSRNGFPLIVGGTNFYIQALLSPFLFDDMHEALLECSITVSSDEMNDGYERLREIDPIAAHRLHPNDHRKIRRYLSLYSQSGVLPSDLFQGEASQCWGQNGNFRYRCCFIWVDASLSVLDKYINQRVDQMINSGLLNEIDDMFNPNAIYTKGLLQAIGVREFDAFFRKYNENFRSEKNKKNIFESVMKGSDNELKLLLKEAVDNMKINTRRLVRRQRRRLYRLKEHFGWDLHQIDATEAFICREEEMWQRRVVSPCVGIISDFLLENTNNLTCIKMRDDVSRHLWDQFVCEACDNRVLRGTHEWEQHKQGKAHRKRVASLKKRNTR